MVRLQHRRARTADVAQTVVDECAHASPPKHLRERARGFVAVRAPVVERGAARALGADRSKLAFAMEPHLGDGRVEIYRCAVRAGFG